jgi:type IV pilus assembly protein PilF
MKPVRIGAILATLAGCALLTACAGNATRGSDDTGDLGAAELNSPGDVYVAMAAEYYRRGQLEVALQRAQKGLDVDPRNARAHYMIAVLYQRIGENARAEKHFSEAARLDPKNSDIRNAWGSFYCAQKRYGEAEKQFKAALANPLYSTSWVAITNSGICARQSGNSQKAEAEFRRALVANPRYGPALFELADMSYARGDYKSARTHLSKYFESNQPTPKSLSLAARVERKLGSRKRAATYETMLRKTYPNSVEALAL